MYAEPATASVLLDTPAVSVQTPVQAAGTAAEVPSLVEASATQTTADAVISANKPAEGVLGADSRSLGQVPLSRLTPPSGAPRSGAERAELIDQLAVGSAPLLQGLAPADQDLVDSRTPLLTVYATRLGGGTAGDFRYLFTVCDVPEVVEGTTTPAPTCWNSGTLNGVSSWRIPSGTLVWGKEYTWKVRVSDPAYGTQTTSETYSFVTGVPQPPVTYGLGAAGEDGQEFNQASGNYRVQFTDAQVATAGPSLSVVRTYNSLDSRTNGIFGAGWSTRWDMKIQPRTTASGTSVLLVTYPDGHQASFAANGDGTFQPPPGVQETLGQSDGGGWKLMDSSSTTYLFDAQGGLTKVVDARGRTQTLERDSEGKLATVTGTGGRALHFTYSGAHVASVSTDPVDGASLRWDYEYDGDTLAKVCAPGQTPTCTAYGSGDGSLYRSMVLNAEPAGYWRLGDQSTSAAVGEAPRGGNGIYNNVTLQQAGALQGTADTAAAFTKSSLWLPEHLVERSATNVSIETWFKTTQSGAIFSVGSLSSLNGAENAALYIGTDGKLRGQLTGIRDSSGQRTFTPITSPASVIDGQWHHVVLSADGERQRLHLDGQQVGELSGPRYGDALAQNYVGGAYRASSWSSVPGAPAVSGAFPFVGTLDEVAVYDRPLTDADITAHFQAREKVTNKLVEVTLPSGRVWAHNTYHPVSERITAHVDQNGGTWQLGAGVYDWVTGISTVTVTDPDSNTLSYDYDSWRLSRLIARTDQVGAKTSFVYDTNGYLKRTTDPNGNLLEQGRDQHGNVISSKTCRAAKNCQSSYFAYYLNTDDPYDPRNDKVVTQRGQRSAGATDDTYATRVEYNQYGDPIKQTTPATAEAPQGETATVAYTDGSESAEGGGSTPAGLVKSETDAEGNTWSYAYTAAGDLARQTNPEGLLTTIDYDVLGREIARTYTSSTAPGGARTVMTYDNAGRLATATSPGVKNEVTNVTHTAQTRYTYDADGNQLTTTVADLAGADAERTTTYTYDEHGRRDSLTDPEGGITRFTFDHLGNQSSSTDPLGTVRLYDYTKRGELASQTLKNWTGSPVAPTAARDIIVAAYSYDPGGRLASHVDAMGRKTSYTYYTDDLLSQVVGDDVKVNGSTTAKDIILEANTYDPAGNLTSRVTGGGKTTLQQSFDALSRLTASTLDPQTLGRTTTYGYDGNGNLTTQTLTAKGSDTAETTRLAYDKENRLIRRSQDNGSDDSTTSWQLDEQGLVLKETDPRGNVDGADPEAFTTLFTYDVTGRLIEAKLPPVQVENNGQATTARPTTRFGYNTAGDQTHLVNPEGQLAVSTFDRAGRLTSATGASYSPPGGGAALIPTASLTYDAAGRLTTSTDARNQVITMEYDVLGNAVRVSDPAPAGQQGGQWVSEYDLAGEVLATVDPTGARVESTYDDLGRRITQTTIERRPTLQAITTRYEYDDAGNLAKQIEPGDKITSYATNAAGETTSVTNPLTYTTTLRYDLAGRPTKVTDPEGNAIVAQYDPLGRQVLSQDHDSTGHVVRSAATDYDVASNPVKTTSGEGHVTRRTFDAAGSLVELIEPVSATKSISTTFGYNASGARTRLTDGRGNATWTTYNSLGLPETVTEPATSAYSAAADRTWTRIYDAAGNEVTTMQPGGVRIDRQFDPLGRLTRQSGSGAEAATAEQSFTYDPAGRPATAGAEQLEYNDRNQLLKVTEASGQSTAYAYDSRGNLTQRIDPSGTASFTWDDGARLATATDPVTGRTNTYTYDKADRLATVAATFPATTQTYTYDGANRPLTHTLADATGTQLAKITYGWDKDDNLTSKTTAGTANAGANSYTYDDADRLTSWTRPDGSTIGYDWDAAGNRISAGDQSFTYDERNRLITGGATRYTYTARGTLASTSKDGTTTALSFDAFDQLVSDGQASYSYDALGRVSRRTTGGGSDNLYYSGLSNDIAAITDQAGASQARYGRDAAGRLLGLQEGGRPAVSTLTDLHGDLIATFDGTSVIDSTSYDPFGAVTAATGARSRLGYQGAFTDPDTGKVNMHARWYQSDIGAFASRDTATLPSEPSIQANRYSYGNGNPLVYTDPTGHAPARVCGNLARTWWLVPLAAFCYVVSDTKPTAHDDVAKGPCKGATDPRPECGKAPAPRPDSCAEFSNKCPANTKKPTTTKKGPSTPTTRRPTASNPAPTYRPPARPRPTAKPAEPKRGPKIPWGRWCGSKCMVDGHGPLEPEDDCRIGEPCWWLLPATVVATGLFEVTFTAATELTGVAVLGATAAVGAVTTAVGDLLADDPVPAPKPRREPRGRPITPPSRQSDCTPGTPTYWSDGMGRPEGGEGRYCGGVDPFKPRGQTARPRHWPATNPPHPNYPSGDVRLYNACHVVASQLGGSDTDQDNLTPCYANVNNGPMKRIETAVRNAIKASRPNDTITYSVDVKYDGADTVVDRFRMRAEINGQVMLDECVHNNLNGTVEDGIYC
ncbi:RHS repeat-associated core domain-containing protein [Nonomuraea sp. NPDC048882]|uniref:RHS repeat-associated core domain-containing protein n=1 Tax=Nonomuraea sp. NPDC048882 TaxID=3154347 RepID=UPI0033DDF514